MLEDAILLDKPAMPEVIDLDFYMPHYSTCTVEQLRAPPFCVIIALLAVHCPSHANYPFVESLTSSEASRHMAHQRYICTHYAPTC